MMDIIEKIYNNWKKFRKSALNSYIYSAYNHKKVKENVIYIESMNGKDLAGNILYFLQELSSGEYGNFKVYVYAKKEFHTKIRALKENYNLKIDKLISNPYHATRVLEYAKYIITDSRIRSNYIKRPGQIMINFWHGTPFNPMGVDKKGKKHKLGKIQHSLILSDYIIFHDDFMKEKIINAFMIDEIFPGKILLEGYPRNSVFFEEEKKENFKKIFGFENKEIYALILRDKRIFNQQYDIQEYLSEIDQKLKDNQILIIKVPATQDQINFDNFNHCVSFPEEYEAYDILNMCDVLITDYSNILIDFANSKRKIILFDYGEGQNKTNKEFYISQQDLPFPSVKSSDELVNELNDDKNCDYSEFLEKYCRYDRRDASKYLCQHIFLNKKVCKEYSIQNKKENILLYIGSLQNNGITSSAISLLKNIDLDEYNYIISFNSWNEYLKNNPEDVLKSIPDKVKILPLLTPIKPTFREIMKLNNFKNSNNEKQLSKDLINLFQRESSKYYSNIKFKAIINFNGYHKNPNLMFSLPDSINTIWVHSDMIKEHKTREIQNLNVLKYSYSNYDNVALVSEDLIESTLKLNAKKENIKFVHNICNNVNIINNSKKPIKINKTTEIETYNSNGLKGVLNSPGKKIITIGRFSHEKGHERLLMAFDRFCESYPDTQLIIIGGHGDLYDETLKLKNNLKHWKNVTTIKWISNPMPILKECDLFVLSSYYEGWPMVIMEADSLNLPVIATDISGTRMLRDYDGHLVENSQEGILKGLYDFMNGKVKPMQINYDKYNENAIKEFYSILKK